MLVTFISLPGFSDMYVLLDRMWRREHLSGVQASPVWLFLRQKLILLGMLHTKETRISLGHLGLWLMCAFTFLPGYRVQVVGLPWG